MTNPEGQSTSALFGFIRSVQKLIKDMSAEHFICVFDGPDNKKSRREVYADYKMHRKGAPEDLFPQFEWAAEYCTLAGIPWISVDGVEADDTMATIAVWAKKKGATAYLCSSDKDLMQLVGDHIFMIHAHKENALIDAKKVEELFGVRPDQMLDLLAIMGDSSDNIPGLEGFGPKTAAALLQEFGTLDKLLAHPERVKGEKKQEVLRTQADVAHMSRKLATLDLAVKVPHEESAYALQPPNKEKLADFFHKMGFKSLLREMSAPTAPAAPPAPKTGKRHTEQHHYTLVNDLASFEALMIALAKHKELSIDTETTSVHPMLAELVGIGFACEPGEAWYVPFNGEIPKATILEALRTLFTHAAVYGHNLKYDWHVLKNAGVELPHIAFDTMLASYLLRPDRRQHNLDALALEEFKKVKTPIEELIGKGKAQISMSHVPIEKVKDYCCEDVDYTCRLKEHFVDELGHTKLDKLLHEVELPLLPILARMEHTGIYLDSDELHELGRSIKRQIGTVQAKIFKTVGHEFNLNSPKQLSEVLYDKLKLEQPRKKKSEYATSADVLEELAIEHPIAREILEYRTLEKLRSTYIEALPEAIHPKTGRIHCNFNQSVAATGRLSCQDPNLQNIPVRSPEGLAIRACFKPERRGWRFVGADYSQIELRLLAHFSKDPELTKAFRQGDDIHAHTASLIFGVKKEAVTPEMRAQAKTVNFGVLYGQGPFALSRLLSIPHAQASAFIKTYFERYPRVDEYFEECKEQVRKSGFTTTLTGRRRPIPEIHNKNPAIRAGAERLAVNTPLQGTAADLIKMAMIAIDKQLNKHKLKSQMLLQIHDELIFEAPDDEVEELQKLVKKEMEGVLELHIPIEVHIGVGKNWAEC